MKDTVEDILNNIQKILIISVVGFILIHIAFLVILHVFDHDSVYGLSPLFDLSTERNFPTWFATIILFISSILLYLIYQVTSKSNPDKFWIFLSMVFLYLSVDEMVGLHEKVSRPIRELGEFTNYFYYSWIFAGLFFVLVVFILSIPFLKRLPSRAALHFIIAGAIFVMGAVGMELPGANVAYSYAGTGVSHEMSVLYDFITTIEEMLELTGIIFFNYALMRYLKYVVNNKDVY